MAKTLGNIKSISEVVIFVCDMQERFRSAISAFPQIAEVVNRLTQSSRILDFPLIVTEQYPKGLGNTVSEIDISNSKPVVSKTKFSMLVPEVEAQLAECNQGCTKHVILCGIETHVCIQQTVIDLLSRGLEVHVVADAVSSRSQVDRMFALERFRHMGATVTTSEAILLQLVGDKDHPKFKEVQSLIKVSAPDTGLLGNKL